MKYWLILTFILCAIGIPWAIISERLRWKRLKNLKCPQCGNNFAEPKKFKEWQMPPELKKQGEPNDGGLLYCSYCKREFWFSWHGKNIPKRDSFPECPSCHMYEFKIDESGLWDGKDENGKKTSGAYCYATCINCNMKLIKYKDTWNTMSEEAWKKHIDEREKILKES